MTGSFQNVETSNEVDDNDSKKDQSITLMQRIGYLPFVLLLTGVLGILAFIGCVSFLWFSTDDNPTWKNVALAGWTTQSIAIAAVVLRTAIVVQAGVACSMLAGILLEGPGVPLPKLATVSIMRSTSPAPYQLFWHTYTWTSLTNRLVTSLTAVLTITTIFLQFTSTILLADVKTGLVTAQLASYPITIPKISSALGDFKWNVGVRQYPVFAEYTEAMVADGSSGISDTGLTMRAFLPIDSQGNISSIHKYKGPATVVDSRVVCVRPNITNLGTHMADYRSNRAFPTPILHGNTSIALDLLKGVRDSRVSPLEWQKFNCSLTAGISPDQDRNKYHPSDWNLSICQLDRVGGYLRSAWMRLDDPPDEQLWTRTPFKKTYLLVNFSSSVKSQYTEYPKADYSMIQNIFDDSIPGLIRRKRREWTDVYRTNDNYTADDAMLSFSLCFPSFETSYLNISASSTVPLVQPRYRYDPQTERIRFDDVRRQMLSSPQSTMEQRGTLALDPQPWTREYEIRWTATEPPYLGNRDTETAFMIDPFEGAQTMNLMQWYQPATNRADISIGGLLLDVLRNGDTVSQAVQSMMTALLASRYQDYVFLEGSNVNAANASRADLVPVQIPGGQGKPAYRPAGATRPYVLIMAGIALHVLTVSFVVTWFSKATNVTYLWESWSNISQVLSTKSVHYVERAAYARDAEVKKWIKDDGSHKTLATVVARRKTQEAHWNSVELRARRGFVEQNESEQGLVLDEMQPVQASRGGSSHSVGLTRASSTSSRTSSALHEVDGLP